MSRIYLFNLFIFNYSALIFRNLPCPFLATSLSCLKIMELLARNSHDIWNLVCTHTLNYLDKLVSLVNRSVWLNGRRFVYEPSDCRFEYRCSHYKSFFFFFFFFRFNFTKWASNKSLVLEIIFSVYI